MFCLISGEPWEKKKKKYAPQKLTAQKKNMEVDGSDEIPFQRADFQVTR